MGTPGRESGDGNSSTETAACQTATSSQTAPRPLGCCCFVGVSLLTGGTKVQKPHRQKEALCLAEAQSAESALPSLQGHPQPFTPPEAATQQPGCVATQPPPSATPGNKRPPRCISGRGRGSKKGVAAAINTTGINTTGMEEKLEQREEEVPPKAEDPKQMRGLDLVIEKPVTQDLPVLPPMPRERSSTSPTSRAATGSWLPETPLVSIATETTAAEPAARQTSRNSSIDSREFPGAPQGSWKTASTKTGGASSDEDTTPSVLFPIAEDATANIIKAKAKPKRQAKSKGRRQQSKFKSPEPASIAHEVFLEEIEVRPGDAECFCLKCRMDPAKGGLPSLSLVEAWTGSRHSARFSGRNSARRQEKPQEVPPREKKKGSSGRGRTRGAQPTATGNTASKSAGNAVPKVPRDIL